MQHLLVLGHRRIAHLTESEVVTAPGTGTPHALRLQTYLDCMQAAGLASFIEVARSRRSRRRPETTARADQPDRTARRPSSPPMTSSPSARWPRSQQLGLTAHDVSVAGYDNTRLAAHPALSLTSMDQSGREMGADRGATMLLERIAGRTEPRRHEVTPTLQVRRSSAPPHAE